MPKTHPKPSPASTALVIAGQPSRALLDQIKTCGSRLSVELFRDAINALECSRSRFVTEAIAIGLMLEAKKQTQKHGEFQRFAAEVWASLSNGKHVSHLPPTALHNFTKSLRVYALLGKHFLADLEQGNFQPDGEIVSRPALTVTEALALTEISAEKRVEVYARIEQFAAGRSLRRLLMDFRRAETAADAEELAEDQSRKRKSKQRPDDPLQMDFLNDLKCAWDNFDAILGSPEFQAHATKDGLLQMAAELEAKAKALRTQAKTTRA